MMFITLDQAKDHLRVDHDEDDQLIESYIYAASSLLTDYCTADKSLFEDDGSVKLQIQIATMFYVQYLYDHDIEVDTHEVMPNIVSSLLYGYRGYTAI